MSTIKNYQKMKFSQIDLDDGNKILISYGATDMRVFKIGFLSLPKETVHIFDNSFLSKLNSKIGYDLSKDVVKILAEELVKASKIEEIKEICTQLEKDKKFIEKI